jgi:hypothetical protein
MQGSRSGRFPKDPTDDGIEIALINMFKAWPEGRDKPVSPYTPLQLWQGITRA